MIEIFNNTEVELVEICEDESMGIKYKSKTTIDVFDIHRCSITWYVLEGTRTYGTRIIMLDAEEIIVAEKYEDIEAIRRKLKADFIQEQNENKPSSKRID